MRIFTPVNRGQSLRFTTVGGKAIDFRRFFKQVMGQSFMTYANHFRIGRAQPLLESPKKPIIDISQETGFCDQSYFSFVFRQLVHMTPSNTAGVTTTPRMSIRFEMTPIDPSG